MRKQNVGRGVSEGMRVTCDALLTDDPTTAATTTKLRTLDELSTIHIVNGGIDEDDDGDLAKSIFLANAVCIHVI